MKTRRQWFNQIQDDEIRENALLCCSNLDKEDKTLDEAIDYGINWAKTPQGFQYWESIWYIARDNPRELTTPPYIETIEKEYNV